MAYAESAIHLTLSNNTLQGLLSTKKLGFHWEWFRYPCGAYTESAIYATLWNSVGKPPNISFRKFRSVWKTQAVSMRNVSCAQVCQKHFGETNFQLWSGFTKWEMFENTCRVYNESALYSTVWNAVRKASLSNICRQVRSFWKLVRSLFGRSQVIYSVIQHWVWKPSFNSHPVSLTYKCLKTSRENAIHSALSNNTLVKLEGTRRGTMRKVTHTRHCEKLWRNNLSSNICFSLC